ncbi:START domain-containing protein [Allohahella marinimesophila]|uniref:START domain-containing protein n=1 Tax=Allohahella marinimesophila TaxID=1054972 RepID=A0ABP7NZ49_9GAMM
MTSYRNSTSNLRKAALALGMMGAGVIALGASEPGEDILVETFDYPDSAIKAVRIEAIIDAPITAVMAVFADVEQYPKWIYNCTWAELVDSAGFYDFTAYQISNMPWPVTDRDLVLTFRIEETKSGGFMIRLVNQASEWPSTNNIRVTAAHGFYHLEPLSDASTLFRSEQHFDPSGDIPVWLINQLLEDIPTRSVIGMRKLVRTPAYRSRKFERDEHGRIVGWLHGAED